MSFKTKILAGVSAACVLAASIVPTFAAGSVTGNVTPVNNGTNVASLTDDFTSLSQEVQALISDLNNGANLNVLGTNFEGLQLLSTIQDLQVKDENGNAITENVIATFEVPNLTEAMKDIKILHYSTKSTTWELITPDSIDYEKKQIVVTFKDLSPVAIVYRADGTVSGTTGTGAQSNTTVENVSTGVQTNTVVYAVAAIIALGAVVFVVKKQRA